MFYYQSVWLKKNDLPEEIAWDGRRKEIQKPAQSGFDYDEWPIVRRSKGALKVDMAHWEFIPFWINDKGELEQAREKYTTLDARGETLLSLRMFAQSARERHMKAYTIRKDFREALDPKEPFDYEGLPRIKR
jgi:putative SOS response-associated peptidase YedK